MGRLRALFGREAAAILCAFGFVIRGQRGSHVKLRRIGVDGSRQTLLIPLHSSLDRGTLQAIFRQASSIHADEFRPHFYVED